MHILRLIQNQANQVLPHHVLISWLESYQRPNDKIKHLKDNGYLTAIRRGLYIAGPQLTDKKPDPKLIANHILGPSYVSLDTALSFYGLIPERVFETTSATLLASRKFDTVLGRFSYIHIPLPYYSFGIRTIPLSSEQNVMIATPEKALCDKIITTSGINLRSVKSAEAYLLENLRIEKEELKKLDFGMIQSWLPNTPKKGSISMFIKFVSRL